MANRNLRWLALTLFALANLALWVGVAAAIGLAVSQSLNLGMEALIREGQATAAAVWERIEEGVTNPETPPDEGAEVPAPVATETTGDQPIAAVVSTGNPATADTPQPGATPIAETTPRPAASPPTIEPEATLVSSPLLLADPAISNLAELDAEMAQSAPARAVQIRYQEDALNAEIARLWQNNPELPYRNVHVDLRRDQVVITGKVTILSFEVNAEAIGQIAVKDCVPMLEIEQISIAGVMTPRFIKGQVESMIMEAMTWYPADYPMCLEQIVLEETRATVYGYRR